MSARWPFARPVRMPLQLGKSALVEAAIMSAITLTGATLGVMIVLVSWFDGWTLLGLALIAAGAILGWVGVTTVISARASDVILSADGLRVDGGPRRGVALRWDELVPGHARVEAPGDEVRGHRLRVGTVDQRDVLLAEVWQDDDVPALHVLVDEIRAVHGLPPLDLTGAASATAVAPAPVDIAQLRCAACAAVVPPVDADHASCRHCHADVIVPATIRDKVRAAANVTAQQARIIALLEQPGAGWANLAIALCALAAVATPVLALIGVLALRAHAAAGVGVGLAAWGGAIALGFAITCLGWLPITRRAALRACLFDLGARRDGETFRCRTCSGGLPDPAAAHDVVIRCVYCASDNLLGVDPRPWQQHVQQRERSIAQVLEERRASLTESRWALIVFGVIGSAAWAWLLVRLAASS